MINRMRDPLPGQTRVSEEYLKSLQVLSPDDITNDPSWFIAIIAVTSNKERRTINSLKSTAMARKNSTRKFLWDIDIRVHGAENLSKQILRYVRSINDILTASFVIEAPAILTENINPSRGLSNGTPVIMHSLSLKIDDRQNSRDIMFYETTSEIELELPPTYINVSLPNTPPEKFKNLTLIENECIIPVPLSSFPHNEHIPLPGKKTTLLVTAKPHACDLAFSMTNHKLQGRNCNRLVIDINERSLIPKIEFHSLYVALTRVHFSKDLRILPYDKSTGGLQHLLKLNPSSSIGVFLKGFDNNNKWKTSLAKNAATNLETPITKGN